MLGKLVVIWCVLLLVPLAVLADTTTDATQQVSSPIQNAISIQMDQANRYLSAENTKAIDKMKEDIIANITAYDDSNFQLFDNRMQVLMMDTKIKLIVGSLGVILLANGVVALVMIWVTRNFSYEAYLTKIAKQQQVKVDSVENAQKMQRDMKHINDMKQEAWETQVPMETLAMKFGEAEAANTSEMNAWQHQPAYRGAWRAPEQHTQQYRYGQYAEQRGYNEQQPSPDVYYEQSPDPSQYYGGEDNGQQQ